MFKCMCMYMYTCTYIYIYICVHICKYYLLGTRGGIVSILGRADGEGKFISTNGTFEGQWVSDQAHGQDTGWEAGAAGVAVIAVRGNAGISEAINRQSNGTLIDYAIQYVIIDR